MKTYKIILSALALAVVFSLNTFAQVTENVKVTAKVESALTFDTPGTAGVDDVVAFGTIMEGSVSYIKANSSDNTAEANLGNGAHPAEISIEGSSGASISLSYTNAALSTSGGSEGIVFTPTVFFAGESTAHTSGNNITLDGTAQSIYIGGSLAAISAAGEYSTDNGTPVTITVQYN